MNLNISEWNKYMVGDLFDVVYGINLELNACIETTKDDPEAVNFVSRSKDNNGVTAYIKRIDDLEPQKAGIITVAGGGSSVLSTFVQDEPFYSGRDLYLLVPKEKYKHISKEAKLFICVVLMQNKYRYSFGRQANTTLPYIQLNLPSKNNEPDWEWMKNYIKSLHHNPLTTKNKSKKVMSLDINNWKTFTIGDILIMKNGKGITKEEIDENPGDFTVVQSGEENNGVLGKIDFDYCKQMQYTYSLKPCLTVARSGSAGFVSFQKYGCVVGDSAKILLLNDDVATPEHYLFLQTILLANKFKYAYGRKVTENKYLAEEIKLPIVHNSDGTLYIDATHQYSKEGYVPDWEFIDNYIKSLPYGDRL